MSEPLLQPESEPVALPVGVTQKTAAHTWFHRLSSVLFIIFCFELGLFLLIYPWTDAWTENSLSVFAPAALVSGWRMCWNNSYFRGAISGIGIANIWIALTQVFRMFSRRAES